MSKEQPKAVKNVVSSADHAALEANYTFLPSDKNPTSWQERMVQRYNDGLYREFALAELSDNNNQPGKVGLRWRTRQEVMDGRGEKTCGNKRCYFSSGLSTLEVPFSYIEHGQAKKELVKLKLCPSCLPLVYPKAGSSSKKSAPERKREEEEDEGHFKTSKKVHKRKEESDSESDESSQDRKSKKGKKRKKHSKRHRKEKKRRISDEKELE